MRTLLIVVSVAGISLLVFVAFFAFRPPADLSVTSILVVDDKNPEIIRKFGRDDKHEQIAIVRFKASQNLAKFADNGWISGLYANAYICSNDSKGRLFLNSRALVYDENGSIDPGSSEKQKTGRPTYSIYVDLRGEFLDLIDHRVQIVGHYDLIGHPKDICFVLVPSAPFVDFWSPTNEVRVPDRTLEAAIQQYRASHPEQ